MKAKFKIIILTGIEVILRLNAEQKELNLVDWNAIKPFSRVVW